MHLGHRREPRVGHAQERERRAVAGHVDGGEADLLEDPRAQRVVAAGNEERLAARQELAEFRRLSHLNFSSIACHQSNPTFLKISMGLRTGPSCQTVSDSLSRASARSIAGIAAPMHTAGKITILKPMRSSSETFTAGGLPPATI